MIINEALGVFNSKCSESRMENFVRKALTHVFYHLKNWGILVILHIVEQEMASGRAIWPKK